MNRRAHDPPRALEQALSHLYSLQQPQGNWEGEMLWCPMITAQYAMVLEITGRPIEAWQREGMLRYFRLWQRDDGSWGLHPDGEGYLFVTALVYVALRILGQEADAPECAKAQAWLQRRGGVKAIPTWGKVWLSLMGLYEWRGVHPVLPELWLLPENNPIHPRRYYCHTRLIYLAIGVLQARKLRHMRHDTLHALRRELYVEDYESVDFSTCRDALHPEDIYVWPSRWTRLGYRLSRGLEAWLPQRLRDRALRACMEAIEYELRSTDYACISPVNGLLNVLALWSEDPQHRELEPALAGLEHWFWHDPHGGLRLTGARSQTWDTSFAIQALCAGPQPREDALKQAFAYLDAHQLQEELPEGPRHYRMPIRGGWCFSDSRHRWPVSDCTAEALAALAQIHGETGLCLSQERLEWAAQFLLQRQNPDGGFGSYEARRGNWLLEKLNPSEMYGNCMLEHSYIECTASCIQGLAALLQIAPALPSKARIPRAIQRAAAFLESSQNPDGSWTGFWGVHFTYGTWFGVLGLRHAGRSPDAAPLQRAHRWLLQHRLDDGGWGEDWQSCLSGRYTPSSQSQVLHTSWALLALRELGETRPELLDPALALLAQRQEQEGGWPREGPGGVFFNTAMLHYDLYRHTFPTWALAAHL